MGRAEAHPSAFLYRGKKKAPAPKREGFPLFLF
jgi:hypothetical protein